MSVIVDCRMLSVSYGTFVALEGFSLELVPGRAAVLVGPNGAGKSTCLRVLSGLESESGGAVSVLGQRPQSASRAWRREVGVMPEHLGLFDALSIEEHLRLGAELYGLNGADAKVRIEELLELLGLAEGRGRFAAACSYGMRKKTALALAVLHAPKLLILDEPFEGLDPASCETVLALLNELKRRGAGLIVSSHMLMHVERLADEVLLLDGGKVVWRSEAKAEGELRAHYLDVVKAGALPALEWF
ncbi:MAG: ABC transporter ATP-binding protein [Acidobacteria bacterium]|nr:ABC transporter ATP-binding protein [Acidobacteriota bacterium]